MIISIKSGSGGSSRGLIHYLAHSKLDRAREGTDKRALFNAEENDLDVKEANRLLSLNGTKPGSDELIHLVIAPGSDEFETIGDDLKTRREALQAIVRATVSRLEKEVKARNLKWIAVTHFNTDHPHAHLALQKEFINEVGRVENLRITRQMLHYNERTETGGKILHKGSLITAAEKRMAEIAAGQEKHNKRGGNLPELTSHAPLIPAQASDHRERRILAQEMLVAAEIKRREKNIRNLVEHGDKKRYQIRDEETGLIHHLSRFDIERKILHLSRQKARLLHPGNHQKQSVVLPRITETERAGYEPMIRQLETIHRHVLGFENRHLIEAEEKHTELHNQKLLIEKKYEHLGEKKPLPLLNSAEIQQLQMEAIREQDLEQTLFLENIRQSNAKEFGHAPRSHQDRRELLAAKVLSQLKLEAAEKRFADFPHTKNFIKVKTQDSEWSLNSLEQVEKQKHKTGFLSSLKANTFKLFFRPGENISKQESLDYSALRQQISEHLENLEISRSDEIENKREFNRTLRDIFDSGNQKDGADLQPVFSTVELAEIEDLAQSIGSFELQEKSLIWQENFLRENIANRQKKSGSQTLAVSVISEMPDQTLQNAEMIIGKFLAGRAAAGVVMAKSKVAQAKENINRHERSKLFIKHRVRDEKTGSELELSQKDVDPRSAYYLLDKILLRVFEGKQPKHLRELVHQAAAKRQKELTLNLENSQTHLLRLEIQKKELQKNFGSTLQAPLFTQKEIAELEKRQALTFNQQEAGQLSEIIKEAGKNDRVHRIQELLKNAEKEILSILPKLSRAGDRDNQENSVSDMRNHRETAPSKSIEITSQKSMDNIDQPQLKQILTEIPETENSRRRERGPSR